MSGSSFELFPVFFNPDGTESVRYFQAAGQKAAKRAKRAILRSRVAAGIGIRTGDFISLKKGIRPMQREKILASKGAAFSVPSLKRNTKLLTFFDVGSGLLSGSGNNREYRSTRLRHSAPCL